MREIKFRAWNVINKQMHRDVQDAYDWAETDDVVLEADYFGDLLRDSDFIVEQYTGLKDKNGVEIYEGDILRIHFGIPPTHLDEVVVWEAYGFYMQNKQRGSMTAFYHLEPQQGDIEVIGNIHEKPELL